MLKKLLPLFFLSSTIAAANAITPPENERNIIIRQDFKISVKGHANSIRLKVVLPATIKNRQTLNDIEYSTYPDSVYTKEGNTYAIFKFYDVSESIKLSIKEDITIYRAIAEKNIDADTALSQYLIPEKNIEIENTQIQKLAALLKQKTDIETVMKTYFYVKENIRYKKKEAIGAAEVLESGVGKCMDFSDLFVALLRANKIPSKSLFGLTVWENEIGYHAWPEAYLKKQGWIQFDPTTGHTDIRMEGTNYKMSIKNKYIILVQGRNETELRLRRWHLNWQGDSGTEIKIKESHTEL